jgi:hypothetical protein
MAKSLVERVGGGIKRGLLVVTAVASIGLASCTEQCTPIPTNYAPEFTSTPTITQVNEGSPISYDANATDADGDKLTYSLPLAFPELGLSINPDTGVISGTAPQVNANTPYEIEVGVSDGINPVVTQAFTVIVKDVPHVNNAPTANLDITPNSGNGSVTARITLTGTDADVGDSITTYGAFADYNKNEQEDLGEKLVEPKSTPIDISKTFNSSTDIFGWVIDNHGLISSKVKETVNVTPLPPDYLDIIGYLQDNESDTNQAGMIKIYRNDVNKTPLREESVNGAFAITLDKLVSEVPEGIIIQGAMTDSNENLESYVRTKKFPQGDVTDALVRVVPTGDLAGEGIEKEQFREHMDEVNFSNVPDYGLFKYNISNVEIIRNNPFNTASFLDAEILLIKNKIQNINDIGSYAPGIIFNIDDNLSIEHDDIDYDKQKINPHQGWLVVVPVLVGSNQSDITLSSGGLTFFYNSGLPQVYGKTKILLLSKEESTISHEFGHALAFPEHAITLSGNQSIMNQSTGQSTPKFADKKAAKIVYENTYFPREKLDDIMRLSWGFLTE